MACKLKCHCPRYKNHAFSNSYLNWPTPTWTIEGTALFSRLSLYSLARQWSRCDGIVNRTKYIILVDRADTMEVVLKIMSIECRFIYNRRNVLKIWNISNIKRWYNGFWSFYHLSGFILCRHNYLMIDSRICEKFVMVNDIINIGFFKLT